MHENVIARQQRIEHQDDNQHQQEVHEVVAAEGLGPHVVATTPEQQQQKNEQEDQFKRPFTEARPSMNASPAATTPSPIDLMVYQRTKYSGATVIARRASDEKSPSWGWITHHLDVHGALQLARV